MAGNSYSTYTGNVTLAPAGQQSLIAQPTTTGPNIPPPKSSQGVLGKSQSMSSGSKGSKSLFGNWTQPK
jgi:hypothetical protein